MLGVFRTENQVNEDSNGKGVRLGSSRFPLRSLNMFAQDSSWSRYLDRNAFLSSIDDAKVLVPNRYFLDQFQVPHLFRFAQHLELITCNTFRYHKLIISN
jgi:hypothetical protein